eukprot:TRINITY_DN27168_c0_g1_i1.p1 TRINITY_DN27168_c0_g1~~TRINITY_DN27168_c0_g1_i1.p1  ORF type:complete len:254 (-),score=38.76 TRINITY_DN27168_c0_g1_i1:298-1059(-)
MRRLSRVLSVLALAVLWSPALLFVGPSQSYRSGLAQAATGAADEDERLREFEAISVIDESAKLSESSFHIAPEQLIKMTKVFLAYDQGTSKPDMLAENFQFAGPVVGPLSKAAYLKAVGGFDFKSAFPDFNPEFHHFRVDPFEPSRVWLTARGYGTNTADGTSILFKKATGKKYINPPQACSLRFNKDGLVDQYTIGYVMDRRIGNTGGLGGVYGILYAIGKPFPFPEARPWKMSWQYSLFNKLGNFLQRFQK